jgi:chromosome partitioning protein
MAEPSPSPSSPVDFEELLAQLARAPSLAPLVALHWTQFQEFVGYLFTCAGYLPVDVGREFFPYGVGVDYNLFFSDTSNEHLVARVEVRRYKPENPLDADDVFAFAGKLGARNAGGIPGFLVTTSSFTGPAYHAEQEYPDLVTLIDGTHLLRYITYIHGSRAPQADGRLAVPAPLPPTWLRSADSIRRPNSATTHVLAVGNNRGGVGKTVTALELGIGLAKRGKRTLLLDLDGQGSLTLALPPPHPAVPRRRAARGAATSPPVPELPMPAPVSGDISQYFASAALPYAERVALSSLVRETAFSQLWLVPAGQLIQDGNGKVVRSSLHRMDTGGSAHPQDELAFVEAIADVAQHGAPDGQPYDWIILDTPPAQSRYTRAALAAADRVVICVEVEAFAAQGVNGLLDTNDAMRALMGTDSTVLGALITRVPQRPKAAHNDARLALIDKLAQQHVEMIGQVPVDEKVDLSTRNSLQGGILDTIRDLFRFPSSPAATAYNALIDHLLQEEPHGNPSRD